MHKTKSSFCRAWQLLVIHAYSTCKINRSVFLCALPLLWSKTTVFSNDSSVIFFLGCCFSVYSIRPATNHRWPAIFSSASAYSVSSHVKCEITCNKLQLYLFFRKNSQFYGFVYHSCYTICIALYTHRERERSNMH